MTHSQVTAEIEAVLGLVPFEGATVEFCTLVRDELRKRLPDGFVLDVYHRHVELIIEARHGAVYCKSVLPLV